MEEKKIFDINTVNDYVDFIGAPRQHPVSYTHLTLPTKLEV